MSWTTCLSEEAAAWLRDAHDGRLGQEAKDAQVKFRYQIEKRLEPYGPRLAELRNLKKLAPFEVHELRVDAFRMFLGFGPGEIILIANVIEKRSARMKSAVYEREARRVADMRARAIAGTLPC